MNGKRLETHPLISVHGSAAVADAAQVMSDCSMGAVGVLGPDKELVGIFTERDLVWLVAQRRDPFGIRLSEVVNDFPVVVDGPISDQSALQRMRDAHIRHLLVREGEEVRIVSMRDLLIAPDVTSPGRQGPSGEPERAGWPYGLGALDDTVKV